MAGEKTEEATPKKRAEARSQGQVARSQDLTGATVTLVGLAALALIGPKMVSALTSLLQQSLMQISNPQNVTREGIGPLVSEAGRVLLVGLGPIALACVVASVVINVMQVGFKITPKAIEPNIKKINPVSGAKQIFGTNGLVEGLKSIFKVLLVTGPVLLVIWPAMPAVISMVGASPMLVAGTANSMIMDIARNVAVAYIILGIADLIWQRYRFSKQLRMDKQEVKDEMKNMGLPAEVRMAQKRRQLELARARMMAAVPEADVVVTNPTHFSVALKYSDGMFAPEVVAKGQDLIALRIREIAAENGVLVMPDPPLARGLFRSVEVGHPIPEEFFQAVAHVLAFVYRNRSHRQAAIA